VYHQQQYYYFSWLSIISSSSWLSISISSSSIIIINTTIIGVGCLSIEGDKMDSASGCNKEDVQVMAQMVADAIAVQQELLQKRQAQMVADAIAVQHELFAEKAG